MQQRQTSSVTMRIVLLGPPGSGKGTQASALKQRWGLPHISSGDLLRAHVASDTELGKRAKPFMERGELAPDSLILDMMASRLAEPDAQRGYVLDGFPRTVAQAKALQWRLDEVGQKLDIVVYLKVPEQELLRRLSGRRTCPQCNTVYHVDTMPSRVEGICDSCGANLIQRQDEQTEVVRKRQEVYAKQTKPLLEWYLREGLLHEIDGTIGVDRVIEEIAWLTEMIASGACAGHER